MKKLLTLVSVLAVGSSLVAAEGGTSWFKKIFNNQTQATVVQVPAVKAPESKVGMLKKALNAPKNALNSVEAAGKEHFWKAVVLTAIATLIAEQVATSLYNNYVASSDENEDDEDNFDVA